MVLTKQVSVLQKHSQQNTSKECVQNKLFIFLLQPSRALFFSFNLKIPCRGLNLVEKKCNVLFFLIPNFFSCKIYFAKQTTKISILSSPTRSNRL